MKQRFDKIRNGSTQLDSLCSPTQVCALPFPQSFAPLPSDRFSIKADGTFDYMGREKFNDIVKQWDKAFVERSGVLQINVYGTPGSAQQQCVHEHMHDICSLNEAHPLPP